MSSTDKKKVHDKPTKEVNEQEKEVLEEIIEELEEEAKEKKEEAAKEEAEAEDKEASEENNEETSEEETDDKKKGLFNKKEKKDPLKEKIDELNDRLIRQVAEFDNFRKRTDKEKNFERGLQAVPEDEKDGAFADGMNKIYKQLMKQMEDLGVTPIEAVGKEFDPNFHNAVMQVESEEYESGIVAQELQKGYMFHDTVLRHSMVGVTQ